MHRLTPRQPLTTFGRSLLSLLHAQFFDFVHLLSLTGNPSESHSVLFNGDFVDRGSWSVEIALTIFAFKWLYPRTTLVNRGNHETADSESGERASSE